MILSPHMGLDGGATVQKGSCCCSFLLPQTLQLVEVGLEAN